MATSKSISPLFQTLLRPSKVPTSASRYVCTPCLRQQQHFQQQRSVSKSAKPTKKLSVPKPTPFVPDVETFLKLIGRGLSAQTSKIPSWDKLFTMSSEELKDAGIEPARTRRYLLRWRQKFRNGDYGVGGDFKYVSDGTAELRVCEVPATNGGSFVSATQTPGMTKLVLNVPRGSEGYALEQGKSTTDLKKPKDYKLVNGHVISGPFALPVKGSHGGVVQVKIQEGMWEDRLGQKVFGGERRRAETLHKLGVAEHRKAVGTAR